MDVDVIGLLAQTGAAGVIGLLWLSERRSAIARERQIEEAQARLSRGQEDGAALVRLVEATTRAVTMLEATQQRLARAIEGAGYGPRGVDRAGRGEDA